MFLRHLLAAAAALAIAAPACAASFDFSFKVLRTFSGSVDPDEYFAGTGTFETADPVLVDGRTVYDITGASGTVAPSHNLANPYTITGVGPLFNGESNQLFVTAGGQVGYDKIGLYFEGGPGGLSFASASATAEAFEGSYVIESFAVSPAAVASPAPEPATWATMILGFGLAGAAVRRRRSAALA